MSDLWDYDDEDDQDTGGVWKVASPEEVDNKKRRGVQKPTKTGKRKAASPTTHLEQLRPMPLPTISLLDDSDDEDDLVLLTSPEAHIGKGGSVGTSTAAIKDPPPAAAPEARPAVANLNPATQESLEKEQELLRALQEVTERELQQDEDIEPCHAPSVSRLSRLGLSCLASRLPVAGAAPGAHDALGGVSDDEVSVGSDVLAFNPSGAQAGRSAQELSDAAPGGAGPGGTAVTAPPTEERVQLKLVWGRDKDECIRMRVVKTDPFSKMIDKFKAIATERSLCPDPNKIKFLFDGDDLAKMATETPESMDMEDDMIVDIKL